MYPEGKYKKNEKETKRKYFEILQETEGDKAQYLIGLCFLFSYSFKCKITFSKTLLKKFSKKIPYPNKLKLYKQLQPLITKTHI